MSPLLHGSSPWSKVSRRVMMSFISLRGAHFLVGGVHEAEIWIERRQFRDVDDVIVDGRLLMRRQPIDFELGWRYRFYLYILWLAWEDLCEKPKEFVDS